MFVKEGWMYKGFLSVFVVPLGVFFLCVKVRARLGDGVVAERACGFNLDHGRYTYMCII